MSPAPIQQRKARYQTGSALFLLAGYVRADVRRFRKCSPSSCRFYGLIVKPARGGLGGCVQFWTDPTKREPSCSCRARKSRITCLCSFPVSSAISRLVMVKVVSMLMIAFIAALLGVAVVPVGCAHWQDSRSREIQSRASESGGFAPPAPLVHLALRDSGGSSLAHPICLRGSFLPFI